MLRNLILKEAHGACRLIVKECFSRVGLRSGKYYGISRSGKNQGIL